MDGVGMQFVTFQARDPVTDLAEARRNPFLKPCCLGPSRQLALRPHVCKRAAPDHAPRSQRGEGTARSSLS